MSKNYNQGCSSCSKNYLEKKQKNDLFEKPHEKSSINKVIGIVSGKGGVGKSFVTSILAVAMNRMGYNSAILDADITGPSVPKIFGIKEKAKGNELGLFPVKTKTGIDIMSVNLILENATDPVLWRGPIISRMVKQFWTDVIWKDIDFMFIDMPPGTGDVPLTVFQSIAVDGIIVITSPQEIVSMIVSKALQMAKMMDIPIIGLVENMSFFKCPDNGKEYKIFWDSNIEKIASNNNLKVLAKLPIDSKISTTCDNGMIEFFYEDFIDPIAKILEKMEDNKND